MRRVLVGLAVVSLVVAGVYFFVSRTEDAPFSGLGQAAPPLFDDGGVIPAATRAMYSPDGVRLAVLSSEGLGVAEGGKLRPLVPSGTRIVDAAWFAPSSAVLVAEGPVPTGRLAVIGVDGTDRGAITLTPSLAFGAGYGMSVSADNRSAVVTAVERPTLGREQRYVAFVDLVTGTTRPLTPIGGADEFRPVFIGDRTVAFTESAPGAAARAVSINIASAATTPLAEGATVVGAVRQGDVVSAAIRRGRTIEAAGHRLGLVPERADVADVRPDGREAVLRESAGERGGPTGPRLRRLVLDPPPPR